MRPLRIGGAAATTAVSMIAAVTAAILALLAVLGFAPLPGQETRLAKSSMTMQKVASIQTAMTPAAGFIDQLATVLAEGFKGRDRVERAQPPFPLSCTQEPGQVPVDSVSMTLTKGTRMQATVAVYPAGQGAPVLADQLEHLGACATGSTSTWHTELSGPGTEAHQVHATWNEKSTTALVWRQGDVLAYLVAAAGTPMSEAADAVDEAITHALGGQCLDVDSRLEDASRSPFAPGGYEPHQKKVRVRVDEVPLPAMLEDLDLAEATVPMPEPDVAQVQVPPIPDHPVWPQLPEEVDEPVAPEAPQQQVTSRTITALVADPDGPGCGWAFTGQVAPPFDKAAAAEQLETDRTAALVALQTGQSQWAQGVLDYWAAWPAYLEQVEAYNDYAEQVAQVSAAWGQTAEQWRTFEDEQAQYEQELADYDQQLAERRQAQEDYEEQVAQCTPPQVDEPAAKDTPSQDATSGPGEAPTREPGDGQEREEETADEAETQQWTAPEFCPAEPPAVLDEPEPEEPVAPTPPEDPRPADERD